MNKKIYLTPGVRSLQFYTEGHILDASELPGGGEGELDVPKKDFQSGWLKKEENGEGGYWK